MIKNRRDKMSETYYKGYWLLTNRCNLNCSYCVLENAPHQLKAELDLNGKKELIAHLYHKLNFRRLTLSGGEVLTIGKHPPAEFIELLGYLRGFRSTDPVKNLEIELYTNGTCLTENVIHEMRGVVDMVAVTIDSTQDDFLSKTGRNYGAFNQYFVRSICGCKLLLKNDIKLKIHSVVSKKNHLVLADQLPVIVNAIEEGGKIAKWKFYQYMSYNIVEKDAAHIIDNDAYKKFKERAIRALSGKNINLHFKDNSEMKSSLFNILSYGNAQYLREGDTWMTSQRTGDLRIYNSMSELFAKHGIDENQFRHYHGVVR
jgi:sulfatase maturation enzyme AslB (radical SAM superfamily)